VAHKQLRIVGKKAAWAAQFKPDALRGKPLIVAGAIATRYFGTLETYIARMEREVRREVEALYSAFAGDSVAWAMDASIASQARILSNGMRDKFAALFAKIALPTAQAMTQQVDKDS